ncbi:MAG: NAD+ synthase [Thermodesulfovibrionales bacterium]
MKKLRLALAQINSTVGDLEGNAAKIIEGIGQARSFGADLVAFPELAVTGYPPEDLLLKPRFIEDNLKALDRIRRAAQGVVAVVGFVDRASDIYNAAAVISEKKLVDVYHKMYLPNYGVFDEVRYFQAGGRTPVYRVGEALVGISICEDIWYPEGPARLQALCGAELIININSSPYHMGKPAEREKMLATRASDNDVVVAYVNMVGGQDELVFDGASLVVDERGRTIARGRQFVEDLLVLDVDLEAVFMRRLHDPKRRQQALAARGESVDMVEVPLAGKAPRKAAGRKKPPRRPGPGAMEPLEEIYSALVLGLSDYVRKNGFKGGLIGLSGGVDSALVAAIAADALGRENTRCLFMPSPYTSRESGEDAAALARNLGVKLMEIPIKDIFDSYLEALKGVFKGLKPGVAEENIQARIRGNLLMALSNKFGWLVITTGNKSEMSVGYATLYGDMAGGLAAIKDVAKTLVYDLARWRNRKAGRPLIPERVITREPTAELRPGQKDTDTLPPYEELDPILRAYIERDRSFDEIVAMGADPGKALKVIAMVDRSEYKRRQSPPGIKITPRAFGRDRRFPITNRYFQGR